MEFGPGTERKTKEKWQTKNMVMKNEKRGVYTYLYVSTIEMKNQ